MLSILSGKFKGQSLEVPKSGTRPTSSMVKKALFDTLRPQMEGSIFCDLFAGSGAVGLEALSQGAQKVYFNELSKTAHVCLKKNIIKLNVLSECKVSIKKAHQCLEHLGEAIESIDFFYIDPPYDIPAKDPSSYESLLAYFAVAPLKASCVIILETKEKGRIEKPLENLEALTISSVRSYGDSFLFYLTKN